MEVKQNLLNLPALQALVKDKFNIEYYNKNEDIDLIDAITSNRKIRNPEYKTGEISELLLMKELEDLELGAKLLKKHIETKSKIMIVSDFDADGVGSAATMFLGLKDGIGKDTDVVVLVNDREYGNGVNDHMIAEILKEHKNGQVGLVITVDHGSADDIRYKQLKEVGIDVIVTDHHIPPGDGVLVNVDAFINPQRPNSVFDKEVSGCVIGFCLLNYTRKLLKLPSNTLEKLYPFLAITTISDMMPMDNMLNIRIVNDGLKELNNKAYPAYTLILDLSNSDRALLYKTFSFQINPLINAAGRMGNARDAFNFLVAPTLTDAVRNLKLLTKINNKRKKIQNKHMVLAYNEAISLDTKGLVLELSEDAEGIQGIVAGNLGEEFNKPIVCFVKNPSGFTGSGRAILEDFNLKAIFDNVAVKHPGIILRHGGHKGAAGCLVHKKKLSAFREKYEEEIDKTLTSDSLKKTILIDSDLNDSEVSFELLDKLEAIEPFGYKRPDALFIGSFSLVNVIDMKSNPGLKFLIFRLPNGFELKTFYRVFDSSIIRKAIGSRVLLVYSLARSFFMGRESISINIKHVIHKFMNNDNDYTIDLRDYSKNKYVLKDTIKFKDCSCIISRGVPGSASYDYGKHPLANPGTYEYKDTVGISVNGERENRFTIDLDEFGLAISANVGTFIIDKAKDRGRYFNRGEREVAELLIESGYKEVKDTGVFKILKG